MKGEWIALAGLAALPGACDATYGGFLGVIPVENERSEATHVFLAIDGVSRAAFDRAQTEGAFAGWASADLITYFPAVSDYSWMRMLRAGTLEGFELQHYDPVDNEVENAGLAGVLDHPLQQGLLDPLPCYRKFDFLGDGEAWTVRGYSDPEAALTPTLDALFDVLASRGRRHGVLLAYLMNVDVVSHRGGFGRAVDMLHEIARRIAAFKRRHPGKFVFTIFSDHGNAHRAAELADPNALLRQVGIEPVMSLGARPALEAIPIVHVRVSFVSVHTHLDKAAEVAARASQHRWVDLAAVNLGPAEIGGEPVARFGLYRRGRLFSFGRTAGGDFLVEDPTAWSELGLAVAAGGNAGASRLGDRASFEATVDGPYPDLLYRVATAFSDPVSRHPPQVILSMPDDVASFGFHLPGGGDRTAIDGFHGSLSRGSTIAVLASEVASFPAALRADDLIGLFPELAAKLRD